MRLGLSFAGILETTFLILRRDFRTFLILGLVSQLPLLIFNVAVYTLVPQTVLNEPLPGFLLEGLPTFLIGVLYRGAVVHAADGPYRGAATDARASLDASFAAYGRLVVASVLLLVGTALLSILLVVPGIWFYFAYILVTPVVMLGTSGPIASLRRAAGLARGAWARILGIIVVTSIVTSVLQALLSLGARAFFPAISTAEGLVAGVPSAAIGFIVITLLGALSPIALTVLYHDRLAARGPTD